MRKVIQAFCLFMCTVLLTVQTAQASNPTAADIFATIGGTTTIDRGGAIHSQARSIYSLGGGMVSFQGKKVTLLAADPPSFSAGCNGISWHFGGFAFISLDEIRQLVEAVAQASLGIAVDLAMQTLCPQCYAVMAKLRDMSNMMRNAAADACKVAQNMGAMLSKEFGITPSTSRASDCSKTTADAGTTSSFLDSWAGSACKLLSDAETEINTQGTNLTNWLRGGATAGQPTPTHEQIEMYGNVTFKALTALGYEDGPIKDMMLSVLGMTITHPGSSEDCRTAFQNLVATKPSDIDFQLLDPTSDPGTNAALSNILSTASKYEVTANTTDAPTPANASTNQATATAGGATTGPTVCNAPPVISGLKEIGWYLMCGFNAQGEAQTFADKWYKNNGGLATLKQTSLGAMCAPKEDAAHADPLVYTCQSTITNGTADCLEPQMVHLSTMLQSVPNNGFTGLAWMIGDALYRGALAVQTNDPAGLPTDTVKILNGSGWPLYRLINMAAVYPAMAGELLQAYTSVIAAQYAMDTLDKVAAIGQQPGIDLRSNAGIRPESISNVRENIMTLTRLGNESKDQVMAHLAEKRQMVEVIMQVNKTLQAEVIGQGLSGNTNLAVSIKRQQTAAPANN